MQHWCPLLRTLPLLRRSATLRRATPPQTVSLGSPLLPERPKSGAAVAQLSQAVEPSVELVPCFGVPLSPIQALGGEPATNRRPTALEPPLAGCTVNVAVSL